MAVLVLAACGGGGDERGALTADSKPVTTTSTTAAATPEEQFLTEIRRQLSGAAGFDQRALALAEDICDALDLTRSPDVAPELQIEAAELGLATVLGAELDDAVTATVMRTGTKHLCPDHTATVDGYLTELGL